MKTNFKGLISNKLFLISMMALPVLFSACEKSDDTSTSLTAQEAGTVMAQAVDPGSGGLILQTELSASLALTTNNSVFCGIRQDSTIEGQFSGNNRSFEYSLALSRTLTCPSGTPSTYAHSFTGSSAYNSPAVSSDGNVSGTFTLSGLGAGTDQVSIDQNYAYTGVQTFNAPAGRTITSTVTIQSTDVRVDKTTRQIVSGTATINAAGVASNGDTFNYDGTLTFRGGRQAILVVNGGGSVNIQW